MKMKLYFLLAACLAYICAQSQTLSDVAYAVTDTSIAVTAKVTGSTDYVQWILLSKGASQPWGLAVIVDHQVSFEVPITGLPSGDYRLKLNFPGNTEYTQYYNIRLDALGTRSEAGKEHNFKVVYVSQSSTFTVTTSDGVAGKLIIYDINGKVIQSEQIAGTKNDVCVHVSSGMYIVALYTEGERLTKVIAVE